MRAIKVFLGFIFFVVSIIYFYYPKTASKFNSWIRENIFTDRLLVHNRRQVGGFFLFLAILFFFMSLYD